MYSEALERLIKSVIADGQITDKERAVLYKKAEAEGVDADEIDVYVEGLIAEQSNQSKPTSQVEASLAGPDLMQVKKHCDGNTTRYSLKTPFNLATEDYRLKNVHLIFIREEFKDREPLFYFVLSVDGIINTDYAFDKYYYSRQDGSYDPNHNNIEFKTDKGIITVDTNSICGDAINSRSWQFFKFYGESTTLLYGRVDIEAIRQFCEAKKVEINLWIHKKLDYDTYDEIRYDDKNRWTSESMWKIQRLYGREDEIKLSSILDFGLYAKYAYHSLVDKSAHVNINYSILEVLLHPSVNLDTNEVVETPNGANSKENNYIVRLLGAKPKNLVQIPEDVPCYKKCKDPESGKIIYFIEHSEVRSEDVYFIHLYLRAIMKEDGQKSDFYFETVSNIPLPHQNESKTEPPLELDTSYLTILIGVKSFVLWPLANSKELLDSLPNLGRLQEHNFFAISDKLMQQLVATDSFILKVTGKESCITLNQDNSFLPCKVSKKWKLAYNLMTYPEKREQLLQEYTDNLFSTKIKRLFDKTPKKVKIAVGIFLLLILLRIIFG